MIFKLLFIVKNIFSLTPHDLKVKGILDFLKITHAKNSLQNPINIAVEGVEDALFFGLFAALTVDLKKKIPINAQLVQIRSINGSVGTGFKSKIFRNWFIARLFNDQWARVNRDLVGAVAYRSQPFFRALFRIRDKTQALMLWEEMKILEFPDKLRINEIQIGDLVIDSYLRFKPSPRFDVHDTFVFDIIKQALRDIDLAFKYFSRSKPRLYLCSYTTYIEHGIPARVAVNVGVPVRVYGNLIAFGKKLSINDTYHTANTNQYREKFEELTEVEKENAFRLAESQLNQRLSGTVDAATSYMKVSAYACNDETIPDVAESVVIFLHDFYDSPHIYDDLIFPDFWTWVCFTIQTLSDNGLSFWVKPHPNQISLSEGVLLDLKRQYPEVRFISSKVSNIELAKAGMICGITVYGTVAHELAYLGLPTISCARHPHNSFEFCRTAKTLDEYHKMLLTPTLYPLSLIDMRKHALAFYFMHNLNVTSEANELKAAYINFWTSCNTSNSIPSQAVSALEKLISLPGWHSHLIELQKDINYYE